jgi:hypothetical protein
MGSGVSTVAARKANPQCNAANRAAVSTNTPEVHETPAQHVAAPLEASNDAGVLPKASADAECDMTTQLDAADDTSAADTQTGSTTPLHDSELQRTARQQFMTLDSEAVADVVSPSDWKDLDKGFRRPSSDTYSVLPTVTKLAVSRTRFDSLNIDSDDDATPREQCESPETMSMQATRRTQSNYVSDRCCSTADHHTRYTINIYDDVMQPYFQLCQTSA